MKYKNILFDLDGTMIDSQAGITKSAQYALKKFNIIVEDLEELVPFIGPPLKNSFMNYYGFSEQDALQA
ncbi:MAG: HAD hydrolase-like protein, partial [Caldicoprobacterales bacterium]